MRSSLHQNVVCQEGNQIWRKCLFGSVCLLDIFESTLQELSEVSLVGLTLKKRHFKFLMFDKENLRFRVKSSSNWKCSLV